MTDDILNKFIGKRVSLRTNRERYSNEVTIFYGIVDSLDEQFLLLRTRDGLLAVRKNEVVNIWEKTDARYDRERNAT